MTPSPMTLENMRQQGVGSIWVRCGAQWCHHDAVVNVSLYPDNMTVPSFGPRMVCTVCGAIGADARASGVFKSTDVGMWR